MIGPRLKSKTVSKNYAQAFETYRFLTEAAMTNGRLVYESVWPLPHHGNGNGIEARQLRMRLVSRLMGKWVLYI